MREKIETEKLKPLVVPAALGTAITAAVGLLGGGWRAGAYLGGSVAGFWGAFEYLHARGDELRRKHGGKR